VSFETYWLVVPLVGIGLTVPVWLWPMADAAAGSEGRRRVTRIVAYAHRPPSRPTLLSPRAVLGMSRPDLVPAIEASGKKMAALVAPPSFLGRKRPRKADNATRSRIAALHNVDGRSFVNKETLHAAAFTNALDYKGTSW
jgi:hypothetical protein